MDSALKAIAEPNRRRILELVAQDELTAGEIAIHFAVTRPAISQHLTVLKQAGLIAERREGTRRLYRTRPQGFAQAKLFFEGFWDERLGRLQRAAEDGTPDADYVTQRLSVRRELLVRAPVKTVWKLLTEASLMTRWMGVSAASDPSPGGSYRIEIVPGHSVMGHYLVVDRPNLLAFTWGWMGEGRAVQPGSSVVVVELFATATGTLLRLTHRDLPDMNSTGSHSRGWGHYLVRLADVAAGGSPGPDPWVTDPERLMTELDP